MAIPLAENHWPNSKCAKAFWSQQRIPPYRQLLSDTLDWADPQPGERWLDLGCGSGPLSGGLWNRSRGKVGAVTGVDCAAVNETAYARLRETLQPPPEDRIRFECRDFSNGLNAYDEASFDNAVSGLSISYAEHFDEATGKWTMFAYDRLLSEVRRVVRPGGRFVFSVNVPNPSWFAVAWRSLPTMFTSGRPLKHLKASWRMLRYGRWLKSEARRGRFHYLPAEIVAEKLRAAGWAHVEHRVSYSRQAYIFRAVNTGQ